MVFSSPWCSHRGLFSYLREMKKGGKKNDVLVNWMKEFFPYAEFKKAGIASNTLWPRTTIATAAVKNLLGGQALIDRSRTVDIVADAAYAILRRASADCTGNNFIDEDVLREEGVTDFSAYSVVPGGELQVDLFL